MKGCGEEAVEVVELNVENRIWNIITMVRERRVERMSMASNGNGEGKDKIKILHGMPLQR